MEHAPQQLRFAVWPPPGSPVSVNSWMRELGEITRDRFAPPPFPEDAARGHGQPVIVVPGFCALDETTARLRRFLNRQGFAARPWSCGPNLGPTRSALRAFERLLVETADNYGAPIALVGISLGGTIAREIAKRRPGHVAHVVTLLSPIHLPVPTPLAPLARIASMVWADDSRERVREIAEPPPMPMTALVAPRDGIVDWRCCVPDAAPNVETVYVEGGHLTIGSNPQAQRIVAARLATVR